MSKYLHGQYSWGFLPTNFHFTIACQSWFSY